MPVNAAATADVEEGRSPSTQGRSSERDVASHSNRRPSAAGALQEEDNLILTPSKLRLDGGSFALYCTASWLMNSLFSLLLLLKVSQC
jgi:hypothetical protein